MGPVMSKSKKNGTDFQELATICIQCCTHFWIPPPPQITIGREPNLEMFDYSKPNLATRASFSFSRMASIAQFALTY